MGMSRSDHNSHHTSQDGTARCNPGRSVLGDSGRTHLQGGRLSSGCTDTLQYTAYHTDPPDILVHRALRCNQGHTHTGPSRDGTKTSGHRVGTRDCTGPQTSLHCRCVDSGVPSSPHDKHTLRCEAGRWRCSGRNRSGYSGCPTSPLGTAGHSWRPSTLADTGIARWHLGTRRHGDSHTSSGSLARTCPSGMTGHTERPASLQCRCRIHRRGYTMPRWHTGRWRCTQGPRCPWSRGPSSQVPASPLYRGMSRGQVSSPQR